MIISGPIVISCGIIYILWLFNPIALIGIIAFLSFYPCQVNKSCCIFYIYIYLFCVHFGKNIINNLQYFISRATGYFRSKSVNITDARVRLMSEILECIKLIKMYSWEKYFSQKLLGENHLHFHILILSYKYFLIKNMYVCKNNVYCSHTQERRTLAS